jgi:hypothetical protein
MAIKKYDLCINPDPEQIIWRYMSLEKFESILKNKALFFFCRADRFSDPYEGSIPKREADYRIKERKNGSTYLGNEFDPIKTQQDIDTLSSTHRKLKKLNIINCWHINNSENDAMWRLYLNSNEVL